MPDLERTSADQPAFSSAENAAQYTKMLDAQAEEAPASPEAMVRENTRLVTDVHTLLASFPPGDERDAALTQFPEAGDEFSVAEMIDVEDLDLPDTGRELHALYDRAVAAVGGPDKAAMFLHYPGLTSDEKLAEVRPVPTDWVEASNAANKKGPQMEAVLATKLGRVAWADIAAGNQTWEDMVYGYLDQDQVAGQKELVAKLHAAFRAEPHMPVDHPHPNTARIIPDARFGHVWRAGPDSLVRIGRIAALWAEHAEGVTLPPAGPLSEDMEHSTIEAANVERLNALFGDERFKPYVNTLASLFEAAEAALDSDEGDALMREHRQDLNSRRRGQPSVGESASDRIEKLVAKAIGDRVDAIEKSGKGPVLPRNLDEVFAGEMSEYADEEKGLLYRTPPISAPGRDEWL